MIGKLDNIDLREVWKNEAVDFTPWLQENIDVLGEAVGLALSSAERELAVGDFSVDLRAEDESGSLIIIENQLEKSNHDHLGKLVTYLSNLDAKTAIWIVSDPRPEHVQAISWLNESMSAEFYLVKVQAVRIGDSSPAPLFTLIVGPSEEGKAIGKTKKGLAERRSIRERFWNEFAEKARERSSLYVECSPNYTPYLILETGRPLIKYYHNIRKDDADVQVYMHKGQQASAEAIFNQLMAAKSQIEAEFGEPLEWIGIEGRKTCFIRKSLHIGGYEDEARWPEIQDAMIDAMIKLESAFRPHIEKLEI